MFRSIIVVIAVSFLGLVSTAPPPPKVTPQLSWNRMQAFPFSPIDMEEIADEIEDAQEDMNELRQLYIVPQFMPTASVTPRPTGVVTPLQPADQMAKFYCGTNLICPQGTKLMPMKVMERVQCLCVKTSFTPYN